MEGHTARYHIKFDKRTAYKKIKKKTVKIYISCRQSNILRVYTVTKYEGNEVKFLVDGSNSRDRLEYKVKRIILKTILTIIRFRQDQI